VKDNFERCLAEVLKHEGGWADHPKDPGGATMKGVTIGTFAQFKGRKVTKDELRAISDADLRAIYRRKYWDVVKADDLPAGLDLVAFDAAVNSGPSRGARWLQDGLGVAADGKVGPMTIRAAQHANVPLAIGKALDARLAFLRRLKTWPTFGKGWQRRVDDVRRVAIEMAQPQFRTIGEVTLGEGVTKRYPPAAPSGWAAIIAAIVKLFRRH
jgi:lysozyme family protein